jgi:hypothetical protein
MCASVADLLSYLDSNVWMSIVESNVIDENLVAHSRVAVGYSCFSFFQWHVQAVVFWRLFLLRVTGHSARSLTLNDSQKTAKGVYMTPTYLTRI